MANNKYEITMDGITFSAPTMDEAIAMGKAFMRKRGHKDEGTGAKAPVEKIPYKKANGDIVMCTPKQVAHFEELKANASERKERFEKVKAEWNAAHDAYTPSEELIKAIKANRAGITKAIAKEKYGFVGTKQELAALKDKVLAK